jgi:hypothetical protein
MHLADKGAEAMAERFYRYFRAEGILDRLIGRTPLVEGTDQKQAWAAVCETHHENPDSQKNPA